MEIIINLLQFPSTIFIFQCIKKGGEQREITDLEGVLVKKASK